MTWRAEVRRGWSFLVEVGREARADRISGLGAEIAFFALLGLLPAMVALAAILGELDRLAGADVARRVEEAIVDFFQQVFAQQADDPVDSVESLFGSARPGVFTVSLVAAVWAVGRSFAAVIRGLDLVYERAERRSWLGIRLNALLLGFVSTIATSALLVLLVVGPLIGPGRDVADAVGAGSAVATAWDWFRLPLTVGLLIAWAATVFHIAPSRRTPWRWELPGALVAAAWWGLSTYGFRLYLALAGAGSDLTGALGGTVAVVIWLYMLALGFLMGGEVNSVLAHRRGLFEDRRFTTGAVVSDVSQRVRRRLRSDRVVSGDDVVIPNEGDGPAG